MLVGHDILKTIFKNSFSRLERNSITCFIIFCQNMKLVSHHSMGMNHMSVGFSKWANSTTNLSNVNEYLLECLHLHPRDNCLSILIQVAVWSF
jgi:hypothetical protein